MILYINLNDIQKPQIENILSNLENQITIQKTKLKTLLQCLKNINSFVQETENIPNSSEITNLLRELKINLDNTRSIISDLNNAQKTIEKLLSQFTDSSTPNSNDLVAEIENYNKLCTKCKNKTYDNAITVEQFIFKYIKNTQFIFQTEKSEVEKIDQLNVDNKNLNNIPNSLHTNLEITDNNILLISEIQNKIFLPYVRKDLEKKLRKNSNYKTLNEIIDNEYIVSFDKYKNAPVSRFRESYNLMRKKEKASIADSLDLALELTFNTLLNPAVITACKNLDELDVYLDCLNSNELDKFTIFEVKYEILPK